MEKSKQESKRILVGEVVSDKMNKTIVVKVVRTFKDRRFHKVIHKTKAYKVHDEHEQARIGDTVEFYEGRPLSKTKYMYFSSIVGGSSVNAEKSR